MSGTASPAVPKTRSRAMVGITVSVLVVVMATVIGVRWWTHPTLFGDLGDSFASDPLPAAEASLSAAVTFPQVDGEPETVTIDGATAVFSQNTAEATATFSICHLGAGEDPILVAHDPARYCQDIQPLEAGATFHHGHAPDSDYLLITITPTTDGVAHLARIDVAYRRGASHLYQRGTESIRVDRKVTAT